MGTGKFNIRLICAKCTRNIRSIRRLPINRDIKIGCVYCAKTRVINMQDNIKIGDTYCYIIIPNKTNLLIELTRLS